MEGANKYTLYVIAAEQAPTLILNDTQCIVQADVPELKVGHRLSFDGGATELRIEALTLVLGKLVPVDATEYGHRYIVQFDKAALSNNISGSYEFEIA